MSKRSAQSMAGPLEALVRGWRRRCPHCGQGALYERRLRLHECCSNCGWTYLLNQGDTWGFLLLLDRAILIFPLIAALYLRAYAFLLIFWIAALLLVAIFIYTTPNRCGFCIALDYLVRTRRGVSQPVDP